MTVMITTPLDKPPGESFTVADLERMPDDGRRYEIIDGVLIVSPSPIPIHQIALTNLLVLLYQEVPQDLRALPAPLDVVLADDTAVEPDILVARRSDFGPKNLPAAPLLAVEVLSPSSRRIDRMLKFSRYAEAGIASYWIVDPEEPRLLAFDLVGEDYVEVADISGDEEWTARAPFPVTIRPNALLA